MIEIKAMFPVMVTADLAVVQQFYQSVFGFSTAFYEPGFYLHLVSESTGVQLGFLVPEHASQPNFLHAVMDPNGYVVSLEVSDAQHAFSQAQLMRLDIAMPLKDEAWGQSHFIIRDPVGIYIDVVQHK